MTLSHRRPRATWLLGGLLAAGLAQAQTVFINEIHYDNTGTDAGEGVEIAGPAGMNLTGWTVVPYNGSGGASYTPVGSPSGVIPDQGGGFGTMSVPITGLQNGAPDGLALVNPSSVVIQFLSYEGVFTATNGPANTMTSVDIGVSENGSNAVGTSLQLQGTGSVYTDFTWTASPIANTFGAVNTGQTFTSGGTPTVGFDLPSSSVVEGGTATVDVTMSSAPSANVTVDIADLLTGSATSGTDYPVFSTVTLTFTPAGTYPLTQSVSVPTTDDPAYEGPEDIDLGLTVTSGTANTSITAHQLTIADNELPSLVINEVDYEQPGTDLAEWIELMNTGGTPLDLTGMSIELLNGNGGGAALYQTIVLPSFILAPGGYYVVGNNAGIPNLNLLVTPSSNLIQNGAPDAIGLRDASSNLLDALSYEGTSGAPYAEMGGTLLEDPPAASAAVASIGRIPDGSDTDDNTADFQLLCTPSPGAANAPSTDTDGDLVFDCLDDCPLDPLKVSPGQCGCGAPDTDTDGDLIADCNDGCPNDPLKIVPGICGCGVSDADTDSDGTADCNDLCPADPNKIAPGVCGCGVADTDSDSDGTADCNDGCPADPNKTAPGYCGCGNVEIPNGTPCSDGDACTVGDTYVNCACVPGPISPDTDGDGICDVSDNCPNAPGVQGDPCDDGDPNTTNDVLDGNCVCAGMPPSGCVQNEISLTLNTDANGGQTSWEIVVRNTLTVVCSGPATPPYADNAVIVETCCLPDGCYELLVYDSFGDGMTTGSYVLRDANSDRIIDAANGSFGFTSTIGSNLGFCLSLGTDELMAASCDVLTATLNTSLRAVVNPAVSAQYGVSNSTSGYQFWVFEPHGSYNRRIFLSHAVPGPGAPYATPPQEKASWFKLSSMNNAPAIPQGVLLNVRLRSRVNGLYAEFGPTCKLLIPVPVCQTTQLTTTANPVISCGATNVAVPGGTIHANAVAGANKYQFNFTAPGYARNVASATRSLTIGNWATNPLGCGITYDVKVRASLNNGVTWCPYGATCQITTAACPPVEGASLHALVTTAATPVLDLWPNPNRGDQLYLELSEVEAGVKEVTVDLYDLYGRRVMSRTIAVDGGFNTVLDLDGSLAKGVYMLNLTAGDRIFTERLVIE